jgi:TolB-like protein/class 3 adenylate cyclase/Tfp pilus assembly protein PilF
MSADEPTRRLAAILATDVVNYTRLVESDEAGTLAAWRTLQARLTDEVVVAHRGRIFKNTGDGFLAIFDSAVDAAACAVMIQQMVADDQARVEPERRIVLRIGVNLGDVYLQDDDVLGDGVIIASRVETAADPGGVLVTRAVADQVRGRLDVGLVDGGKRKLKNVARPVRVTKLVWGETAGAAPDGAGNARRSKRVALSVLGAILAIAAVVGGWYGWNTLGPSSQATDPRPTVAVLPFAHDGAEKAQNDLADGLAEDVITALGRFTSLAVISRNSSFRYKERQADLQTLGRELGARYVLDGSVRRDGGRIRISAKLADTTSGSQIWAERYDREGKGLFELQDEIAQSVASMLVRHITQAEIERARRKRVGTLDVYELYVQGLALQRGHIESAEPGKMLLQARALFERAIKLDPRFAPSHVGLANNYLAAFIEPYIEGEWRNPAVLARAAATAEEALRLEPTDAMALSTLAWVARNRGSKEGLVQAESLFRRAQAANPSLADGRFTEVLIYQGRSAEALDVAREAMRLNHFYPPNYDGYVGHAYILLGRAAEGISSLERCMARAPTFRPCHYWLAAALADAGRVAEARLHAEATMKIEPTFRARDPMLMQLYQRAADRERMATALERAGFPR